MHRLDALGAWKGPCDVISGLHDSFFSLLCLRVLEFSRNLRRSHVVGERPVLQQYIDIISRRGRS